MSLAPDASELEARALDERAHAEERRAVQRLETQLCEHAVAAAKRHHVGDRGERAELQELVLTKAVREIAEETLREHERDTGASELLVGRRIAGTPRVHDARTRREARPAGDDGPSR